MQLRQAKGGRHLECEEPVGGGCGVKESESQGVKESRSRGVEGSYHPRGKGGPPVLSTLALSAVEGSKDGPPEGASKGRTPGGASPAPMPRERSDEVKRLCLSRREPIEATERGMEITT